MMMVLHPLGSEPHAQKDLGRDGPVAVNRVEAIVEPVERDPGPEGGLGLAQKGQVARVSDGERVDGSPAGRNGGGSLLLVEELVQVPVDPLGAPVENVP